MFASGPLLRSHNLACGRRSGPVHGADLSGPQPVLGALQLQACVRDQWACREVRVLACAHAHRRPGEPVTGPSPGKGGLQRYFRVKVLRDPQPEHTAATFRIPGKSTPPSLHGDGTESERTGHPNGLGSLTRMLPCGCQHEVRGDWQGRPARSLQQLGRAGNALGLGVRRAGFYSQLCRGSALWPWTSPSRPLNFLLPSVRWGSCSTCPAGGHGPRRRPCLGKCPVGGKALATGRGGIP